MRKILLFTFTLISSLLSAQSGLVTYFSFDVCDNVVDDSGNSNAIAFMGQPLCLCGASANAAQFNGGDDSAVFLGTINEALESGDFSISFYMKPLPPAVQGTQVVMIKQETCSPDHSFWVRYNYATKTLSSGISENDTLLATVSAKLDLAPCWQHIVLSRALKDYRLYINGTLRDVKQSPKRIDISNDALFSLSTKVCDLDRPFTGYIDELRVYKKALDQTSIDGLNKHPDEIANRDTLIYLGNSMQMFTTSSCATGYSWSPIDGISNPSINNPILTPTLPTTYKLSFIHPDGCVATDTIRVTVVDSDTLDCTNIYIPNAFTPGGTPGLNDKFSISNKFAVDEFISFEVFDRWGGRVFNADSQFQEWDGSFDGKPLNPGVFLYRLRYKCNSEEKIKNGTLTLLR